MSNDIELLQGRADVYLAALRKQLTGLPADEVEEIVRELRSHIAERVAAGGSDGNGTPVEQILRQLGTPEEIGALYRADAQVAHARASFSPILIIRTTMRWATKTSLGFSAFLAGVVGYSFGAALIVCAALKPFFPAYIGLWINRHGMVLGAEMPRPLGQELLGWWIIPYGFGVGIAFIVGITVLLRWMLRFAPRVSRRIAVRAMTGAGGIRRPVTPAGPR
jgi:uncharacterized membrane protein